MAFPAANSRRIFNTVSNTNIPISPPDIRQARSLDHRDEGSFFDADHPATGVLFPRRSTVTYTILGVGILIQQSIWLFNALKLVGAAYLVWLGTRMLRTKPVSDEPSAPAVALSDPAALRTGFLTNALNPKTTIFIVSLFMQVVQPATPLAVQIGYGAFISAAHVVWFALVATFFSAGRVRDRIIAVRHWIDRVFGALLVGFGLLLARTSVTR